MKKAPFLLVALIALVLFKAQSHAQTNLANLGSNNFNILLTLNASVTQTATNLTFSPTALGGIFGGSFTNAYNWSAYSNTNIWSFGLFMSVPGTSTNAPFTVEIFDSLFNLVAKYQGAAPSDGAPTFVTMSSVVGEGSTNFADIGGFQMTWDNEGGGSLVVESVGVAVVPEPSTWAMLILSAALLGGLALRRRLAAARR